MTKEEFEGMSTEDKKEKVVQWMEDAVVLSQQAHKLIVSKAKDSRKGQLTIALAVKVLAGSYETISPTTWHAAEQIYNHLKGGIKLS